jgi:hypothetical protein
MALGVICAGQQTSRRSWMARPDLRGAHPVAQPLRPWPRPETRVKKLSQVT